MKTISYNPSNDELVLKLRSLKKKPSREIGRFKLWWDDEGCIYGVAITSFMEELKEFKNKARTIQLGGIWKGVKITEKDIEETRQALLEELEGKW